MTDEQLYALINYGLAYKEWRSVFVGGGDTRLEEEKRTEMGRMCRKWVDTLEADAPEGEDQ